MLRVATFNAELSRNGPGLLLRDINRGDDPQITAVLTEVAATAPDILALQGFDYDLEGAAAQAFTDALAQMGLDYSSYAAPPNAGRPTGLDLDGDGKAGGPRDAQGFGRFWGEGAMLLFSQHPIVAEEVQDFSALLWQDLPGALLPETEEGPFPSPEALAARRLSSHGHWVVPIEHPEFGRIEVLTYHATPPVFDGPEDQNGKRNRDETAFWLHYLDGAFGEAPKQSFLLIGDANLDPERGDGRRDMMQRLLADPRLQDPLPQVPTVRWEATGPMRVDYVLPSADWRVLDAGVRPINPQASRHALVWVDLTR